MTKEQEKRISELEADNALLRDSILSHKEKISQLEWHLADTEAELEATESIVATLSNKIETLENSNPIHKVKLFGKFAESKLESGLTNFIQGIIEPPQKAFDDTNKPVNIEIN